MNSDLRRRLRALEKSSGIEGPRIIRVERIIIGPDGRPTGQILIRDVGSTTRRREDIREQS